MKQPLKIRDLFHSSSSEIISDGPSLGLVNVSRTASDSATCPSALCLAGALMNCNCNSNNAIGQVDSLSERLSSFSLSSWKVCL